MVERYCYCTLLVTQVFLLFNIVDTRNDTNDAIQKDYAKSILDVIFGDLNAFICFIEMCNFGYFELVSYSLQVV